MTRWVDIHNAFDPFSPIPPEKLDSWFVERPASPLGVMLADFDPGKLPRRTILVGHPANGKSSELAKLAAELKSRHGYFVVRINLEQNLDIDKVNPVEVVFLMGAAIYKVASAELSPPPSREHLEALSRGLETIVRTHTENKSFRLNLVEILNNLVCYGAGLLAGPVAAGAAAAVISKVTAPFRFVSGTDVGVARKLEIEPQVEGMVERLNLLIADVEAKARSPLALIVDGLDRIPNPDVIALNFADKEFLADPACRVVYTAPIEVYYSQRFAGVRNRFPIRPFPNVKLRTQDHPPRRVDEGYAVMREVVRRRIESLGLRTDAVIDTSALDALAEASGGVMRDLISLIQEAATEAEIAAKSKIDFETASMAILARRRLYAAQLTPRHRDVLKRVRATHQRTDEEECDQLLRANLILSYVNREEFWFDAHGILDWEPTKPRARRRAAPKRKG